jgi:PAS domain S-box-containing protein
VTPFVGQAGSLKRQCASQIAGFAAVIIAAAALIGGWSGRPLLSSWGTGLAPMRPSAALCLGALGVALMHPGKEQRVAFAVGLAVAAVAAVGLAFILINVDPGIDAWLARDASAGPGAVPFRVASVVAVALGLAGGALALSRFERHRLAVIVLGSIAGAIAVFALLGYLAGIDTLYGPTSVSSPALPSAVGLLCIAAGIILRIESMPVLRKSRPLWQLLAMLGCAIVVPLLMYGAYAGFRFTHAQLHDVREDLAIEARTLSGNIDRYITGEIERMQALAASPSLRRRDFAEFQQQAEAALTLRRSGSIVLIDRNMQQLVNTRHPYGKTLPKAAATQVAERVLATGQPQVSGLFWAPAAGQLLVTIMVPVTIDGENRYVLARSPDQHAVTRLVAAKELPAGWQAQAVVSDSAHRIIAQSNYQDPFIGNVLPRAQWQRRSGSGEVFEFVDSEAQPALQANTRSDLTGWVTAVWAPRALLEAAVRAQWRTLGVTAFLALTLVIASALWLGRIIARSVRHAARAAIALGEGGPLPVSGTPVAEVDTLMAELRGAAVRRQAAEDLLRDNERHLFASRARLQIAMDAARLGWWQYDPRRRLFSGDARAREIFNVTADETPIEEIAQRVHPDDTERFRAARATALDAANPKPEAIEYRVRRGDGTVRWVELHWLAYSEGVRSERAAASVVGTVADITERKEREEQVHLLMREVNHRAKNMLSVVDSIAHQTATRNPEDFIERFSERIQALSANQDLLIRSDWSGVDIADLTRAQLAHFADLIGSRIVVDGPKLRLKPASAQAIGLALHELATNAGKYGALSTGRGRVHISWKVDRDILALSWTEREGPTVSQPSRRGFGTIVMEAMAERSVDGAVNLDYAPSGLTWRLTCPAASALEPWERETIPDERSPPLRPAQAGEGKEAGRAFYS